MWWRWAISRWCPWSGKGATGCWWRWCLSHVNLSLRRSFAKKVTAPLFPIFDKSTCYIYCSSDSYHVTSCEMLLHSCAYYMIVVLLEVYCVLRDLSVAHVISHRIPQLFANELYVMKGGFMCRGVRQICVSIVNMISTTFHCCRFMWFPCQPQLAITQLPHSPGTVTSGLCTLQLCVCVCVIECCVHLLCNYWDTMTVINGFDPVILGKYCIK